jgi:hypothetical protein
MTTSDGGDNRWVQVGRPSGDTTRQCWNYEAMTDSNEIPSWGDDTGSSHYKRFIKCCGGDGLRSTSTLSLCPLEKLCPNGPGKAPEGGRKTGSYERWAAFAGGPTGHNDWVKVGQHNSYSTSTSSNYQPLCYTHAQLTSGDAGVPTTSWTEAQLSSATHYYERQWQKCCKKSAFAVQDFEQEIFKQSWSKYEDAVENSWRVFETDEFTATATGVQLTFAAEGPFDPTAAEVYIDAVKLVASGVSPSASPTGLGFGFNEQNQLTFGSGATSITSGSITKPESVHEDVDEWHHWTATFNHISGSGSIYHNGRLTNTGSMPRITSNGGLIIGADHDLDKNFAGVLDEIRLWNRELSSDGVSSGFNRQVRSQPHHRSTSDAFQNLEFLNEQANNLILHMSFDNKDWSATALDRRQALQQLGIDTSGYNRQRDGFRHHEMEAAAVTGNQYGRSISGNNGEASSNVQITSKGWQEVDEDDSLTAEFTGGQNSYIRITPTADLTLGNRDWAVQFWAIRPNFAWSGRDGVEPVVSQLGLTANSEVGTEIGFGGLNKLKIHQHTASTTDLEFEWDALNTAGDALMEQWEDKWTHWTISHRAQVTSTGVTYRRQIWMSGNAQTSVEDAVTVVAGSELAVSGDIYLGMSAPDTAGTTPRFFQGRLDQVRFWNKAIDAYHATSQNYYETVAPLWDDHSVETWPGLVAHLMFTDKNQLGRDFSGLENHGVTGKYTASQCLQCVSPFRIFNTPANLFYFALVILQGPMMQTGMPFFPDLASLLLRAFEFHETGATCITK